MTAVDLILQFHLSVKNLDFLWSGLIRHQILKFFFSFISEYERKIMHVPYSTLIIITGLTFDLQINYELRADIQLAFDVNWASHLFNDLFAYG